MNVIKTGRLVCSHIIHQVLEKNSRSVMTASKLVDVQVNNKTGVYTVAMQHPPVNSMSLELVNELISVMINIEKNKGRGMIITSSLPGIFTAGLDLKELYKPNQDRIKAYWTALQDMWLNLYSSNYSTVAALSGHSPGGGCLIAVSCDYRVMVQGKHMIGLNETQLGLPVPSWFIDTFRNVLSRRVSEMALIEGKLFNVDEALNVGLIDEVATDNKEAITKAEQYISKLSRFSMTAMTTTKLKIRYDAIKHLKDNREDDLRVFLKFINSPEIQKGMEIYLENLKKKQ